MESGEGRVRNEVSGSDVGKVFQAGTMHVALGAVGGGPAPTALASLPAPPVDLVGRGEVSEVLLALLAPSAGDGGPVLVSAVAGLAGVGKTALALYAAHEAVRRGWFPGGVLYVPLRGYRPGVAVSGEQAVGALLRALGVRDHDVPPTAEEQAGLYRSELARRASGDGAVLVLADDASAVKQVAPLVPADSCHRLLVTSRDSLHSPGFPARLLPLGVLGAAEAGELVATALRRARPEDGRAAAEPEALAAIAEHCGYLPLALQIAAALLVDDPGLPLADLAEELADRGNRLDALRHGDGGGMSLAVAGAFELSYRRLPEETARVLRLTTVNPGPDVSTEAVAVLAELGKAAARRHLAALARANLLAEQPVGSGRWRAHDLVRLYAARLAEGDRASAWSRLWKHYVDTARAASFHLPGQINGKHLNSLFTDQTTALAWLDAERANLTTGIGLPETDTRSILDVGFVLGVYLLYSRHHHDDALHVAGRTLEAATTADDSHSTAAAFSLRSAVLREMEMLDAAIESDLKSVEVFRSLNDPLSEAQALLALGITLARAQRFEEAIDINTRALAIHREHGDRHREAQTMIGLATVQATMGRHDHAMATHRQALALCESIPNPYLEAVALVGVSHSLHAAERFDEAVPLLLRAHARHLELGNRFGEAVVLVNLGTTLAHTGRHEEAVEACAKAVSIHHAMGNRFEEGSALGNLGVVLQALGRREEAVAAVSRAVALLEEFGHAEAGDLRVILAELGRTK
ncbi:tetratricopeptide repeat protein [Kitasatospora sp. NPDC057965]|uniref:tetratricopeptide repeat protein n=1 Tax=Kitasatospora sp. NPDC057965 TaxID=3346291 RepID=UPI0036DA7D63